MARRGQTLLITGVCGFGTAIGVHPVVGYNSLTHLAPAMFGATMFVVGIGMSYRGMCRRQGVGR